jgi:iron complex transport system substrate-binding protein
MNKQHLRIVIVTILISIVITGCTAAGPEVFPQDSEQEIIIQPSVEEIDDVEEISEDTDRLQVEEEIFPEARFTISAAIELQRPITLLYEAFFEEEAPAFVDADADLIAAKSIPRATGRPTVEATFLPEIVFLPGVESLDVIRFINFAISPEGQQLLIDAGELPAVISVTDQAGNTLDIQQPLQRVISAFGPATSIVYSIGGKESLVAASYTGAGDPLGASVMERIDPRFPNLASDDFFSRQNFNIEEAATLDPNLIIGSARSSWVDVVDQLGISVFLMDAETPQQLKEAVSLIGEMFGPHSSAQAQAWIDYYDFIIAEISDQIGNLTPEERVKVLFTGTEPLRVASGDMYQTDIIEAAGGISVSANLLGFWNDVNIEQIAIWDPDVIIVPPYGGASVEAITESTEWQILTAVQNGRVYRMPRLVAPWDTPGPDSVMGIIWMVERLYPDLTTFRCETETEYFYNTFLNYPISGEEIAAICLVE